MKSFAWIYDVTKNRKDLFIFQRYYEVVMYLFNQGCFTKQDQGITLSLQMDFVQDLIHLN